MVDHAPPTIAASYDQVLLWTSKNTVSMRDLSNKCPLYRIAGCSLLRGFEYILKSIEIQSGHSKLSVTLLVSAVEECPLSRAPLYYMWPSLRKPGIWDFFMKVEFDVWLISFTIELTHIQVSDQLHLVVDTVLCLRLRHTPNDWEITVQRHCYGHIWRFRILCLRMTQKSFKWTWAELFEMNVKIEQELNFVVDNGSRLFLDAQEAKRWANVR